MTALSWTEHSSPSSMYDASPRSTAPNQMLARSPTRTSPTSTAVGARNTSRPIAGALPSSSSRIAINDRGPPDVLSA